LTPIDQMSENALPYPLTSVRIDRAIERRGQTDWLRAQLSGSAQILPLWRERNLFHLSQEKGPLYLDSCTVTEPLDTIFLGVRSNGRSLFAADVSDAGREDDALKLLNLTGAQAH